MHSLSLEQSLFSLPYLLISPLLHSLYSLFPVVLSLKTMPRTPGYKIWRVYYDILEKFQLKYHICGPHLCTLGFILTGQITIPHSADDLDVVRSMSKLILSPPLCPMEQWSRGNWQTAPKGGWGCGPLLFLATSAHADQRECRWKQTEFFPDTILSLSYGSAGSEEPLWRDSGWRRGIYPTFHSLISHFFCFIFFLVLFFPFNNCFTAGFWGVTTYHTFLLEKSRQLSE